MRDVKKVLEMRSQNYSQRQISVSLKISRDTIRKIFNVADDKKVCWSSVKDLSESDVQNLLNLFCFSNFLIFVLNKVYLLLFVLFV